MFSLTFRCLVYLVFAFNFNSISALSADTSDQQSNAISYTLSGGRLGDNLMAYMHAKWLSYKSGLPLLYTPFPFSSEFSFSEYEHALDLSEFQNSISINHENQIDKDLASTLFVVPYFPECRFEYDMLKLYWLPYFQVDWDDPEFLAEIVKMLAPKHPIKTIELPRDKITVGVHVRRGGGVDPTHVDQTFPLKFPPDSFYIEQIRKIANYYSTRELFVYIFTDDLNPKEIMKKYKKTLKNKKITFDCRTKNNNPHTNILEDFFSIPKFDCFILCQSNFSLSATKLGHYKIKITPMHATITNGEIQVDEVEVVYKK